MCWKVISVVVSWCVKGERESENAWVGGLPLQGCRLHCSQSSCSSTRMWQKVRRDGVFRVLLLRLPPIRPVPPTTQNTGLVRDP